MTVLELQQWLAACPQTAEVFIQSDGYTFGLNNRALDLGTDADNLVVAVRLSEDKHNMCAMEERLEWTAFTF